jgi:cytochrome c-type protein NapB
MKRMISLGLVLTALACAGEGGSSAPTGGDAGEGAAPAVAISDTDIGLSKVSVFDVATPEPVNPDEAMPGENPVPVRPYDLAPPVISHTVADFLPITAENNYCIVCHNVEEKVEGEPTPIPASHFVDLRNAPDEAGDEVAGARYNCIACHARTTDAAPLVANEFQGR